MLILAICYAYPSKLISVTKLFLGTLLIFQNIYIKEKILRDIPANARFQKE